MPNNPNAFDNIKDHKWKKGQSGNPNGRPKLPDLRDVMSEILSEEKDGTTALKRIIQKLQELAEQGNIKASEVLLARGYGLPKQQIEHSGSMDIKNISVEIIEHKGGETSESQSAIE